MTNLRKALFFALFMGIMGIYLASCGKSDEILDVTLEKSKVQTVTNATDDLTPTKVIDDFILNTAKSNNDVFDWNDAPNKMLYSAIMWTDSIVSITYVAGNYDSVDDFFEASATKNHYRSHNKLPNDWIAQRNKIIDDILNLERKHQNKPELSIADILPSGHDDVLPHIYLKITTPLVIKKLRDSKFIKHIEPRWYIPALVKDNPNYRDYGINNIGCYPDPAENPIPPEDFQDSELFTSLSGSKVSWNYRFNGITDAWQTPIASPGKSAGEGIGVCIIDSGVSNMQPNLNSEFNSGLSNGRTFIDRITTLQIGTTVGDPATGGGMGFTYMAPSFDECGHGTAMAGIVAGPLSGDGNAVGVAYKADLMTIRATHDVLINGNEIIGVRKAITTAADNDDINIISMSIAMPPTTSSGEITTAIKYAAIIKGKLIFAAAGTSFGFTTPGFSPVLFPANLSSNLTVAITGAKRANEWFSTGELIPDEIVTCNDCHDGSQVDFAIVMQSGVVNTTGPITLPMTPNPSFPNRPKYTGGTSSATATAAGIAALVWAAHPNASKNEIFSRLILSAEQNSDIYIPTENHGFGVINAEYAINAQF